MHDLDTTPDPDDREAALERGFSQHDTLRFRGKALRPLTISSWRLLQRTGNHLLQGNSDDAVGDAAGFILLHVLDEDEHRLARMYVWRGTAAWNEYIHHYLYENPDIVEDLMAAAPMLRAMVEDFTKTFTRSVSAGEAKKKSGALAG
jgi:hypothetical protein